MKIKDETDLLKRVLRKSKHTDVVYGVGDDGAVIRTKRKDVYRVATTDIIIEDVHFSRKYFTPEQIGMKAIEVNASDIAAMGGKPNYCLVSLGVPKGVSLEYVKKLFNGMYKACKRTGTDIIGGDTSRSDNLIINISMGGEVTKKNLCLRKGAKKGDFVCVTGRLGGSEAGRLCLLNRIRSPIMKKHLEPKARMDVVGKIAPYASSMIDLSDGVATDLGHICRMSKKGCVIYKDCVPVDEELVRVSNKLKKDAYCLALYGGEDFELMFTVSSKNMSKIKCNFYVVGEITSRGMYLISANKKKKLKKGFDHFD